MIAYKARLKSSIHEKLRSVYPVELADLDMAPTPDPKMGDLALTFPFQLAKKLKKAPRAIAQEAAPLRPRSKASSKPRSPAAATSTSSSTGARSSPKPAAARRAGPPSAPEERKIVVEHTNINPNKAAHIGHLRNACLGDTLVRCLRYKGETVEVQNYIDDTGVQVVDVVFGLLELEKKTLADLERPARQVRLLLLGPLRPRLRLPRRAPRGPGPQGRDLQEDRARRGPRGRAGPLRLAAHRPGPPGDDEADRHRLRRPALREHHPAPEVLGEGLRAAQGDAAPSISRPRARTRAAGSCAWRRTRSRRRSSSAPTAP